MTEIKIGKHIGEKTIDKARCNVVIVDQQALNYPILLATQKQWDEITNKVQTAEFDILEFKIDENKYACNGIRNYLRNNGITVEKVIYLDGFLKIVTDKKVKKTDILKVLNIPRPYGYFPMGGENLEILLIDLEEYENDVKERNSTESL